MTVDLGWMDYPRGVLNKQLCLLLWEMIGWMINNEHTSNFIHSNLFSPRVSEDEESLIVVSSNITYSTVSLSHHNQVLSFQFIFCLTHSRLSFFRKNETNFHFVSGLFPPRNKPDSSMWLQVGPPELIPGRGAEKWGRKGKKGN